MPNPLELGGTFLELFASTIILRAKNFEIFVDRRGFLILEILRKHAYSMTYRPEVRLEGCVRTPQSTVKVHIRASKRNVEWELHVIR